MKTGTQIFIAALFITARREKHPNICQMRARYGISIQGSITHQFLKMKCVLTHATMWVNLENISVSERSQSQEAACCMMPFI